MMKLLAAVVIVRKFWLNLSSIPTASKALDAATSTLSETTSALEASDDCGSGWVVEFLIVGIPSLKT